MTELLELPLTDVEQSADAVSLLTERTGLSKTRVKEAMSKGAVWLKRKGRQGRTLTAVAIKPGRKHQIRIHLSEKGYPIVGDRQYGSTDKADLQLASVELSFTDPLTGAQLTYSLAEDQSPALHL